VFAKLTAANVIYFMHLKDNEKALNCYKNYTLYKTNKPYDKEYFKNQTQDVNFTKN
jgi:hypothetical protein